MAVTTSDLSVIVDLDLEVLLKFTSDHSNCRSVTRLKTERRHAVAPTHLNAGSGEEAAAATLALLRLILAAGRGRASTVGL